MFNAQFISATEGTSKKTGNPWYSLDLLAITVNGNGKYSKQYCTETAFNNARMLKPGQACKVACGVDDFGRLTVSNIKTDA